MRIGVLVLALLAGCSFLQAKSTEHRVKTQDEAGSVHIAVLSVARWENYKQHLQPKFDLTAEQALARVLSISGTAASKQIENTAVSISGNVGAPGIPGKPAPAPTTKPGSTSALPKGTTTVVSPQSDPMTQYWAATALYQEVQLLNRYVDDAAIRKGYSAYVLRLQISLLPRARNEPYDAYSNVSFFVTDQDEGSSSRDGSDAIPGQAEVLPLLVTDNLEATLASNTRESMRQIAASLAAGATGGSGSVGVSRKAGEIDQSTGLDLNSLLAVARVSGNTLRIRLGAMRQGSGYGMVPRSHAVTVLVMVKQEQKHIAIVSRTTMVDVKDGSQLRDRTQEEVDLALLAVGERYGIDDLKLLYKLLKHAQANNVTGFYEALANRTVPYKTSLWLDLVSVRAGSQYNSLVVDLSTARAAGTTEAVAVMPPSDKPVKFVDDGTTCTLTLPAAPGLVSGRLQAALIISGTRRPCEVVIADGWITIVYAGTFKTRSGGTEGVHLELEQGKAFATYRQFK